jgi:acyl carrier protein
MSLQSVPRLASAESLKSWLIAWLANEQGVEREAIDPSQAFLSYGLDSVQAMSMVGDLEAALSRRLPPTLAWDYPNIDALAAYLADRLAAESGTAEGAQGSPQTSRAEVEDLLAKIDQFSDRDVDGLLSQYLAKP